MKERSLSLSLTLAAFALACGMQSQASTYRVIYTFLGGADGEIPEAQLIEDSAGNLYGVTEFGGSHRLGTVFKLTPGADRRGKA